MKGSGVKRGGGGADSASPPRPERVSEIPAWIGLKGLHTISAIFEGLFTFPNSLYLKTYNLFNENNYRNSTFDLSSINLLNNIFCVAQDAMDTKGFGTPTEMLMSLTLRPSINK